MPESLQQMLPFLGGAVAVAVLGAVLPAFWCPSAHARDHVQHFAAGIVTAAVGVEILPEVVDGTEQPGWILAAFAVGGGFMLGLKWFDHWFEGREAARGRLGVGLALAATLDTLVDGLIVGVGFIAGADTERPQLRRRGAALPRGRGTRPLRRAAWARSRDDGRLLLRLSGDLRLPAVREPWLSDGPGGD